MKESTLERRVRQYCETRGMLAYKFVSPGRSGVPDRLILHAGRALFLELKAPGKRPEKLQPYEAKQITAQGFTVAWADNFEDAKLIIDTNWP